MVVDPEYDAIVSAEAGELVWDDLTGANATIIRITFDQHGNMGYWLDNGGRFPWEISPPLIAEHAHAQHSLLDTRSNIDDE
jgi:hypothetical protein